VSPSLQIAPARADDCAELARVHVASWQHAYRHLLPAAYLDALSVDRREAAWRGVLAQGRSELLVARLDGEVAGFASSGACRDKDAPAGRGELWALYVAPQRWSRGIGLALWQATQARLAALGFHETSLWVLAGNVRAIRFYTTVGFAPEPGVAQDFEMGGTTLREIRYVAQGPITTGGDAMTTTTTDLALEGGCDCGHVRYRMQTRPLFVHCCHCRWCQRESGASFALNAMIEADRVTPLAAAPELVHTPSASGQGQDIARCPQCRVALWSHYAGTGPLVSFVRVGTLDQPDLLPPDIHIFTASKQPWVVLPAGTPAVEAYYDREQHWPAESLARRRELLPRIDAYRAAQKARRPGAS
jgi:ribosomal protein S18 acetylase RimI-like enzyme